VEAFGFIFCLGGLTFFVMLLFLAMSVRIVPENTRLSVYRLGRYIGDKGPGIVLVIPIIDRSVSKKLEPQNHAPEKEE
jgi:regulator of protease activity HflC (stomatin/prohibitin superfamily)